MQCSFILWWQFFFLADTEKNGRLIRRSLHGPTGTPCCIRLIIIIIAFLLIIITICTQKLKNKREILKIQSKRLKVILIFSVIEKKSHEFMWSKKQNFRLVQVSSFAMDAALPTYKSERCQRRPSDSVGETLVCYINGLQSESRPGQFFTLLAKGSFRYYVSSMEGRKDSMSAYFC